MKLIEVTFGHKRFDHKIGELIAPKYNKVILIRTTEFMSETVNNITTENICWKIQQTPGLTTEPQLHINIATDFPQGVYFITNDINQITSALIMPLQLTIGDNDLTISTANFLR